MQFSRVFTILSPFAGIGGEFERLKFLCLFPTAILSVCILLKSVMVFGDHNLIFLNNMLLSVLFAYCIHV